MAKMTHKIETEGAEMSESCEYVPSVYLEVSKEQLGLLEVGKEVTLKLTGKVKRLESREGEEGFNRYEISMEMKEVVIDSEENEFTKLMEDE